MFTALRPLVPMTLCCPNAARERELDPTFANKKVVGNIWAFLRFFGLWVVDLRSHAHLQVLAYRFESYQAEYIGPLCANPSWADDALFFISQPDGRFSKNDCNVKEYFDAAMFTPPVPVGTPEDPSSWGSHKPTHSWETHPADLADTSGRYPSHADPWEAVDSARRRFRTWHVICTVVLALMCALILRELSPQRLMQKSFHHVVFHEVLHQHSHFQSFLKDDKSQCCFFIFVCLRCEL